MCNILPNSENEKINLVSIVAWFYSLYGFVFMYENTDPQVGCEKTLIHCFQCVSTNLSQVRDWPGFSGGSNISDLSSILFPEKSILTAEETDKSFEKTNKI